MPGRSKKLALLIACSVALAGAVQPAPGAGQPQGPAAPATPEDALFAQGQFTEAAEAYAQVLARDPGSAGALAGLARVRLYEGREDEAVELARKALAIAPGHPVATGVLAIAAERARLFGPDLYQIEAPNGASAIDFVITDPLPVIRVRISGREAHFLLDTGAPNIMMKRELAEELGLPIAEGGEGVFAGGPRARVERTTVPELELGGIRIRNVPAGINAAGGGIRLPNVEIDGIMGTGVLMHFLTTIDYCSGKLILAPREDSAAFQARLAAAGANVLPMWLVGDHFVFARARMNKAPEAQFFIDTGLAGGGLMANRAALDAAGVVLDETNVRTGVGGGGTVQVIPFRADATLGTLTRLNVAGSHTPGGDPSSIFPFRTGGLLSHGFFRQSRLTFDFEAMRLATEDC